MGKKINRDFTRSNFVLTPEEQKLVTENHNLIYGFARQHNLEISNAKERQHAGIGSEDWYGTLAWALCYAVKTWDKEKGTLGNYAYTIMENEIKLTKRSYARHNPKNLVNLGDLVTSVLKGQKTVKGNNTTEDYCLYQNGFTTSAIDELIDSTEIRLILEKEYQRMGKYGELCRKVLEEGCKICDVSAEMGFSRQFGAYEYSKVFLPRVRAKLEAAFKIN